MTDSVYFALDAIAFLRENVQKRPDFFLLCDHHTQRHCLPFFEEKIGKVPSEHLLVMPAGESHKDIRTAQRLWQQLQDAEARRDSLLLNLGGGVVCDMGGFIASTWKRGMPFIHIPTSLMAQTDAAIGGKNAIDFGGVKNQIGLFQPAKAVCICPEWLDTLPEKELKSGFAEMLKHGILADADYFRELSGLRNFKELRKHPEWIRRSVDIKSAFVKKDFEEKKERKALNFGHSMGHALEAMSRGRLTHGEAVAFGMRMEARIAWEKGMLSEANFREIEQVLQQFYGDLPVTDTESETFRKLLAADKKRDAKGNCFSLPTRIGRVVCDCRME